MRSPDLSSAPRCSAPSSHSAPPAAGPAQPSAAPPAPLPPAPPAPLPPQMCKAQPGLGLGSYIPPGAGDYWQSRTHTAHASEHLRLTPETACDWLPASTWRLPARSPETWRSCSCSGVRRAALFSGSQKFSVFSLYKISLCFSFFHVDTGCRDVGRLLQRNGALFFNMLVKGSWKSEVRSWKMKVL